MFYLEVRETKKATWLSIITPIETDWNTWYLVGVTGIIPRNNIKEDVPFRSRLCGFEGVQFCVIIGDDQPCMLW